MGSSGIPDPGGSGNHAAESGSGARASKVTPRMRFLPRALVACGTGFAVSLLAACGGGAGLLSSDQANSLSNQLNNVSAAVGAHNCGGAANASQGLGNAVGSLPSTVNSTLRDDLSQGASTVRQLAAKDCQQTTPTTTTATTPTATTATTTPTTTTATTTTPPTTTTETTPTTTGTTSTTPSGGGGLGGGNGNNNG
jgi:hypothetical protein